MKNITLNPVGIAGGLLAAVAIATGGFVRASFPQGRLDRSD
jgi:hypothetical protein